MISTAPIMPRDAPTGTVTALDELARTTHSDTLGSTTGRLVVRRREVLGAAPWSVRVDRPCRYVAGVTRAAGWV
jgi:hypothetical protein